MLLLRRSNDGASYMRNQRSSRSGSDRMKLVQTLPDVSYVKGVNTFLLSSMLSIILRARVKSPRRQ
jgi:hypothetical protein